MKTSNKLLLSALLLILISLFCYDYLLRAEFVSGRYKDPYRDFVALKFKDFDSVNIVSSTSANVKFIQGPFKVSIDSNALAYTSIKQKNKYLQINAHFEQEPPYIRSPYLIIISCPKLAYLSTNAIYTANKKQIIDSASNPNFVNQAWNREILMDGFKQDSLTIVQNFGSAITLSHNHIGFVKAQVGTSPGSSSKLVISKDNEFEDATLDILNSSSLLLNEAQIGHFVYHLADSTKMIVRGAAVKHLKN